MIVAQAASRWTQKGGRWEEETLDLLVGVVEPDYLSGVAGPGLQKQALSAVDVTVERKEQYTWHDAAGSVYLFLCTWSACVVLFSFEVGACKRQRLNQGQAPMVYLESGSLRLWRVSFREKRCCRRDNRPHLRRARSLLMFGFPSQLWLFPAS